MEGRGYGVCTLGRQRLVSNMGIIIGNHAVYSDPFAVVSWIGKENRSPDDPGVRLAAARIRRLVFEILNPDDEPPPLEFDPRWPLYANGRLCLYNGGETDRL